MNLLRNQIFARAAFAGYQDRGIARRHHPRYRVGAQHRLGVADHAAQFDSAFGHAPRAFIHWQRNGRGAQ